MTGRYEVRWTADGTPHSVTCDTIPDGRAYAADVLEDGGHWVRLVAIYDEPETASLTEEEIVL